MVTLYNWLTVVNTLVLYHVLSANSIFFEMLIYCSISIGMN